MNILNSFEYKIEQKIINECSLKKQKQYQKEIKAIQKALVTMREAGINTDTTNRLNQKIKSLRQICNSPYQIEAKIIVNHKRLKKYKQMAKNCIFVKNSLFQSQSWKKEYQKMCKQLLNELVSHIIANIRQDRSLLFTKTKNNKQIAKYDCYYQMIGNTHTIPNTFLLVQERKYLQELTQNKKPKCNENHIGVELEFKSKLSINQLSKIFFNAGLKDNCTLDTEYIDGNRDYGRELKIIAKESEFKKVITKTCNILNTYCDPTITDGCGLHVHLDARNRNEKEMFNRLFHSQDLLFNMIDQDRKQNKFAKYLNNPDWEAHVPNINIDEVECPENCEDWENGDECEHYLDEIDRLENERMTGHEDNDNRRYYAINARSYREHKTIEVRCHTGTSNVNVIINFIDLLLTIINNPINKKIKDNDDLKKFATIPVELNDYIKTRINTFQNSKDTQLIA